MADRNEMAQAFGLSMAFLDAYPELKELFNQAVANEWTPDKFQSEFRNTDFYRTRTDKQRQTKIGRAHV